MLCARPLWGDSQILTFGDGLFLTSKNVLTSCDKCGAGWYVLCGDQWWGEMCVTAGGHEY